MRVTYHAASRADEREVDPALVALTLRRPERVTRGSAGVKHERAGCVVVTDLTGKFVLTVYSTK